MINRNVNGFNYPQATWVLLCFVVFFSSCRSKIVVDPSNVRYEDFVFTEVDVFPDIIYGKNKTQGGELQELKMDIYLPKGDSLVSRPLLIFAPGGGFVEEDRKELEELARFYAHSGYVVSTMSYRVLDIERTSTNLMQAILEASHDMKAAIRFFTKDAATTNSYGIDSNRIFIGGYSAGAFTALHCAYVNDDSEVLAMGGETLLNYINDHGGLDGDSGNEGYPTKVIGVISISGALIQADFMDEGDPVLYSIHGTEDDVVPIGEGESDGSGVITQGPNLIHPLANKLNIANAIDPIEGGDHGAILQDWPKYPANARDFIFKNLK